MSSLKEAKLAKWRFSGIFTEMQKISISSCYLYKYSEKEVMDMIENCRLDNISECFKAWKYAKEINESDIKPEDVFFVSIDNVKVRYINPLVKVNPYLINPLAAVVMFKTEEEVAVEDAGAVGGVADTKAYLANEQDSMAFAVSMMIAGDMPLAMKEMGIDDETLIAFLRGIRDAFPADDSPEAVAYAQGVLMAASAMDMLERADNAI